MTASPEVFRLLTVRDVAAVHGVPEHNVREAINEGVLEARRVGRRIYTTSAAVAEWYETLPKVVDADE